MAVKLGLDAKLYFKVGGVAGGGSWTELTNVRDLSINMEKGEADVTTRAAQGWRATKGTLKEGTVEFEMVWDTADAGFTAIKDAYFNNALIGLRVLDGAAGTPAQGLEADFDITNFSRQEPLEEAITVSVTAKITYSATAPQWVSV
ncbi:MAG: phage tail tube protein [Planctomycetota bacterium]